MAKEIRRAFVCGYPANHSRSPAIHGYWLKKYEIAGAYEIANISPEAFPDFVAGMKRDGFVGGNVTIPHKQTVFGLVEKMDDAARQIGAVNTIWLEGGTLCGMNTDWSGFAASLDAAAPGWDGRKNAVVLGAGGAARGILYALYDRGFSSVRLVNRTLGRAEALAGDFSHLFPAGIDIHDWGSMPEALQDAGLLINTTSLWMGSHDAPVPDLSSLSDSAVVSDIVYVPLETPLLKAAAAQNLITVDGLGMLLHQAVPGFKQWFGVRPVVTEELRDLIAADMESNR